MGQILIAGSTSLLICCFLSPRFIAFLRAREFGQQIRAEGPEGHHAKAGTPTMGGIIIFSAIAVPFLVLAYDDSRALSVFGVMIACALLGFADDYVKLTQRRSLGLRARTKLIVTILISVGLWLAATEIADLPSTLRLRIVDAQIPLGVFYPVLIYFVVAGTTSAVNLTDGLDGLAAGSSVMVFGSYVVISFWQFGHLCARQEISGCYEIRDPLDITLVAAAALGACFGFLWWNANPARIIMGDTGSLALGGLMAGMAVLTKTELLLVVLGGLFVVVAMSVTIQILVFRLGSGRRVFRMAPIHHHFELAGWTENTVVVRFWIVTGMAVAFGLGLFYADWLSLAELE